MNNVEKPASHIPPLDRAGLYAVMIVTDRANGEIKKCTPINADLTPDDTRPARYFSTIIINTPMGPIQHEFEIEAATLEEALAAYPDAANQAGADFVKGLQDAALRNKLMGKDFPQPA